MRDVLILAGVSGFLGSKVYEYFNQIDKFEIVLLNRSDFTPLSPSHKKIIVGDFLIEKNVIKAFESITLEKSQKCFLFSTIGVYFGGRNIDQTELTDWNRVLDINLTASFILAKQFVKLVKNGSGGSICFTGAYSSFVPEKGKCVYNVSKAALNTFVENLNLEGESFNFTANLVAPSIIDSEENREWVKDSRDLIKPLEIAKKVLILFENYSTFGGTFFKLKKSLSNR
ncbi:MAG: SDR family oxidoreductase [Melioribacteraceae bacterium]|nr:SDR family oxidoreductase [Melioribacteraceae bacterium]MCF8264579.1 SDR family oxidoreductase [Melioribacteraceae bacterium]